jgi:hypothetical protein
LIRRAEEQESRELEALSCPNLLLYSPALLLFFSSALLLFCRFLTYLI